MDGDKIKYEWVQDRYIDINNELDLSKIIIDKNKYSIMARNEDYSRPFVLTQRIIKDFSRTKKKLMIDTWDMIVGLKRGSGPARMCSIDDIFEDWMNKLEKNRPKDINDKVSYKDWVGKEQEILKSKDLLGNIIVLYTIKRAQNADSNNYGRDNIYQGNRAANFLCECYQDKAVSEAVKFIRRKGENRGIKDKGLILGNITDVAKDILRLLICGDRPEEWRELVSVKGGKATNIATRKMKKMLEKYKEFYSNRYLSLLNEIVEDYKKLKQAKTEKEIRELSYAIGLKKDFLTYVVCNPTAWFLGNARVGKLKFNPQCFRPDRRTNLTVWLFGIKGQKNKGKFWQRLNDWFKGRDISCLKGGKRYIREEHLGSGNAESNHEEDGEERLGRGNAESNHEEDGEERLIVAEKKWSRYYGEMSERDRQIINLRKCGLKRKDVARILNVSGKTIWRVKKKHEENFKKYLKK